MLLLALLLQTAPDTATAIRRAIAQQPAPERAALDSAYAAGGWQPFWHSGAAVNLSGTALEAELDAARGRGLDQRDYTTTLHSAGLESLVAHDVSLSRGALRMARDLRQGRIDPATVERTWRSKGRSFNEVETLRRLREAVSVAAVFDSLEPRDPGYWRLRRALETLRRASLAEPTWEPRNFPRTLRLGDSSAATPSLRARLQTLGDLAADSTLSAGSSFDADVAGAVARFQRRHGLVIDSVVGPATLAALATPLHRRVRQVELALERWRWFADPDDAPLIEVDVVDATLQLRDSLMGAERFAGRVIVGASRTPTPLLESTLARVVFNPAWVVPTKIAREELVPTFRADTTSFRRGNYELLRNAGSVPPTRDNLDAIGRGVTLRQRPGAGNALGRIKFEVVGTTAIHLHDTPSRSLFARDLRTLSHGCIRVQQPAELAMAVLGAEWDADRIAAATTDTLLVVASPPRPVVVRLMYATAAIDEQGNLLFRPDRYGNDRTLDIALQNRR